MVLLGWCWQYSIKGPFAPLVKGISSLLSLAIEFFTAHGPKCEFVHSFTISMPSSKTWLFGFRLTCVCSDVPRQVSRAWKSLAAESASVAASWRRYRTGGCQRRGRVVELESMLVPVGWRRWGTCRLRTHNCNWVGS